MRHRRTPAGVALALAVALVATSCGQPAPPTPRPPDPRAVAAAITEGGLLARLEALATATGTVAPFRAVGSAGYDRAAKLVEEELRAAGWTVAADAYSGVAFADQGASSVRVGGRTFEGPDVLPLIFAPAGEAEGPVVAVDWDPAPTGTGRGCAVTHYGDLPADAIVVVRSGDCLRRDQVLAAQQAGATAFVAVYPLAPDGVAYRPTLIDPGSLEIPAVGVSREVADALVAAARDGATARLATRARTSSAPTRSVIAELPGSEPGAVVMLGAHLDSVLDGPGINDDGSGVAALLEIARALADTRPRATIRLAFWSGEELGLHGSYRYVTGLPAEERDAIVAYLNVDMVASPNGFAGVYDEPGAPAGSNALRALVVAGVERAGGTPIGVDLGGGSDHRAFKEAGIPTGGVFSGAADPVTPEQAATFAARAGLPADRCYHQPCDDVANANVALGRVLAAALGDVAVRLANSPELLGR
jgi:Zn-dependent M28 family amino/carboxypeptidase